MTQEDPRLLQAVVGAATVAEASRPVVEQARVGAEVPLAELREEVARFIREARDHRLHTDPRRPFLKRFYDGEMFALAELLRRVERRLVASGTGPNGQLSNERTRANE